MYVFHSSHGAALSPTSSSKYPATHSTMADRDAVARWVAYYTHSSSHFEADSFAATLESSSAHRSFHSPTTSKEDQVHISDSWSLFRTLIRLSWDASRTMPSWKYSSSLSYRPTRIANRRRVLSLIFAADGAPSRSPTPSSGPTLRSATHPNTSEWRSTAPAYGPSSSSCSA